MSDLIMAPDMKADWLPANKFEDYQLHDAGHGIMSAYGAHNKIEADCYYFIVEQFRRFKVHVPEQDLIEWCWDFAFMSMDQYDPYLFYYGITDVIKTEEAYYYQFSVCDDRKENWTDCRVDDVEMFRYWPKGAKNWEKLMTEPGLRNGYFDDIYHYFDEHFSHAVRDSHPEAYELEWKLWKKYGDKVNDIAHLGIWAAIMWMCSPEAPSREWRSSYNPIFELCYTEGSCLLHAWCFHGPDYFKKNERPVESCTSCGEQQWCVELTQIEKNSTAYICEHCISGGEPFPQRTCGKRYCDKFSCPHHPGSKKSKNMNADRRFGPLQQLEDGQRIRELPGIMLAQQKVIHEYADSVAMDVGKIFQGLLGPKGDK